MHVVAFFTDKPNSLALRLATRPAHLEYAQNSKAVRIGGPYLGPDGENSAGGMVVLETDTIEQARAWLDEDPYVIAGLYESIILRPFRFVIGNPAAK